MSRLSSIFHLQFHVFKPHVKHPLEYHSITTINYKEEKKEEEKISFSNKAVAPDQSTFTSSLQLLVELLWWRHKHECAKGTFISGV